MTRNEIGYSVGGIGLGFILSGIIYPLGYLHSYKVFTTMQMVGASLIFCSLFIRKPMKG
ncbi:MAG: hypothetical protein R3328_09055 [Planococcaceae bacterium]|nr:hypothetical protein [Bacillota bacterium]MDX1771663.1 hypothetical protein [Planococcaceae bacterium]